jgi:hypothetical protein
MNEVNRDDLWGETVILPITIQDSYFKIRCNPCVSCGSKNWSECNIDEEGEIFECTECPKPNNDFMN